MNLWSDVDARQNRKRDADREHLNFLATQKNLDRQRRFDEKRRELADAVQGAQPRTTRPGAAGSPGTLPNNSKPNLTSPKPPYAVLQDIAPAAEVEDVTEDDLRAVRAKLDRYGQEVAPSLPAVEAPSPGSLQLVRSSSPYMLDLARTNDSRLDAASPTNPDALVHERRLRYKLEEQLRLTQQSVSALAFQMESLKSAVQHDQMVTRDAASRVNLVQQNTSDHEHRLQTLIQQGEAQVKQLAAQMAHRAEILEREQDEHQHRTRMVDDEVRVVRQELFQASQAMQQLRTDLLERVASLETQQQSQSPVGRLVQTHESALASIRSTTEQSSQRLERRLESLEVAGARQTEDEQRLRKALEERLRVTLRDLATQQGDSERGLVSRMDALRVAVETAADHQRHDREVQSNMFERQIADLERHVHEAEGVLEDRLMKQIVNVLSATEAENNARVRFQQAVEREIHEASRDAVAQFTRRTDELAAAQAQIQTALLARVTQLEQRLELAEKSNQERHVAQAKALTAHVSRQDEFAQKTQVNVDAVRQLQTELGAKVLDRCDLVAQQSQQATERLREEVKLTTTQLATHHVKLLKDVDAQLVSLRKGQLEQSQVIAANQQAISATAEKLAVDTQYFTETIQKQVTETCGALIEKNGTVNHDIDRLSQSLAAHVANSQAQLELKTTQMDQTFAMFREECRSKAEKSLLVSCEQRIQALAEQLRDATLHSTRDYPAGSTPETLEVAVRDNSRALGALQDNVAATVVNFETLVKTIQADFEAKRQLSSSAAAERFDLADQNIRSCASRLDSVSAKQVDVISQLDTVRLEATKRAQATAATIERTTDQLSLQIRERALASTVTTAQHALQSDLYKHSTQLEVVSMLHKDLVQRVHDLEKIVGQRVQHEVDLQTRSIASQYRTAAERSDAVESTIRDISKQIQDLRVAVARQELSVETHVRQRQATTERQMAMLEKDLVRLRLHNAATSGPAARPSSQQQHLVTLGSVGQVAAMSHAVQPAWQPGPTGVAADGSTAVRSGDSYAGINPSRLESDFNVRQVASPILQPIKASAVTRSNSRVLMGSRRPSVSLRPSESEVSELNLDHQSVGLMRYQHPLQKLSSLSNEAVDFAGARTTNTYRRRSSLKGHQRGASNGDLLSPARLFAAAGISKIRSTSASISRQPITNETPPAVDRLFGHHLSSSSLSHVASQSISSIYKPAQVELQQHESATSTPRSITRSGPQLAADSASPPLKPASLSADDSATGSLHGAEPLEVSQETPVEQQPIIATSKLPYYSHHNLVQESVDPSAPSPTSPEYPTHVVSNHEFPAFQQQLDSEQVKSHYASPTASQLLLTQNAGASLHSVASNSRLAQASVPPHTSDGQLSLRHSKGNLESASAEHVPSVHQSKQSIIGKSHASIADRRTETSSYRSKQPSDADLSSVPREQISSEHASEANGEIQESEPAELDDEVLESFADEYVRTSQGNPAFDS